MTDETESVHKSVLLNETIEGLNLSDSSIVVDGTFGGGGHSLEICRRYKKVKIIAIDQDKSVWEKARKKFEDIDAEIIFVNANFRDLDNLKDFSAFALGDIGQGTHDALNLSNSLNQVDGIILDLGLSSDQLENSGRGFSFMKDEPLLMTMKENPSLEDLTALDIVNTWSEKSLADIIYGYGEEKYRGRIARGIVESRKKSKIKTTFDLVNIIEKAVPANYRKQRLHFATRTFQALRIAVNDELGALSMGLEKGFKFLKSGGRISVISFHSLEDRIVKKFYSAKGGSASGGKENRVAKIITKKPIIAGEEELRTNIRSRSAKLRVLEKI